MVINVLMGPIISDNVVNIKLPKGIIPLSIMTMLNIFLDALMLYPLENIFDLMF